MLNHLFHSDYFVHLNRLWKLPRRRHVRLGCHFHPIEIFFHSFWSTSGGIALRGAVVAVVTFEPRFFIPTIPQIILILPLHDSKTKIPSSRWASAYMLCINLNNSVASGSSQEGDLFAAFTARRYVSTLSDASMAAFFKSLTRSTYALFPSLHLAGQTLSILRKLCFRSIPFVFIWPVTSCFFPIQRVGHIDVVGRET